jgi:phthiocerol/phenolphthiocerol synthesis type-I polyketide synthase B
MTVTFSEAPLVFESDSPVTTLVLFGRTTERIASIAGVMAEWMTGKGAGVGLAEVAHTLNHHRAWHSRFATVCARDPVQAVAGLAALATGRRAEGVVSPHEGPCGTGTVFVYSGEGSQWAGMGRRLLAEEPEFAAAVAELEPIFAEQVGFSLQRTLAAGRPVVGDARVQPVLMGLQLALTELWRSYGVIPDAVIGHSMGEVTAAVVSGALTVAEGLQVVTVRSGLMARLAGQGAMASLELDAGTTAGLIADYPGVSVAGFSSPQETLIGGPPAQVEAVIAAVLLRSRVARRVKVEVASHTALMDPILPELCATLADVAPKRSVLPFISSVTGTPTSPVIDAEYWVANVRQPVRFRQAIATAGKDHATFIEVSPHPMLTDAITQTLGDAHHHSIGTLRRDGDDTRIFHTNLNATHSISPPDTPHPAEPHPALPPVPSPRTRLSVSAARARSRANAARSRADAGRAARPCLTSLRLFEG